MIPRRKRRYYCLHCEEKVSKTLYFQHKRFFLNSDFVNNTLNATVHHEDSESGNSASEDFKFSSETSGEESG